MKSLIVFILVVSLSACQPHPVSRDHLLFINQSAAASVDQPHPEK